MHKLKLQAITTIILVITLIGLSNPGLAEDEGESQDPAEVVAYINEPSNTIPPIKVSDFTIINLTVVDAFGIPWGRLSTKMPIQAKLIWPIIHPNWKPFLGYTSLNFETEIVKGDGRGWFTNVEPSSIANADQGKEYDIKLYAKTDDIAVDYSVVIGIKVTRKDTSGNEFGVSYIYVPVKSSQLNNIKMNLQDTSKETTPKTYVTYEAQISNFGYYKDMFELEFEHDKNLTVSTPNKVIVLEAGETKNVEILVLTAEKLFDIGTPYEIEISAKSNGNPDDVKTVATIRVISKGMYISPLIFIIAIPIIIILIIIFLVYYLIKTKRDRELLGKPDKPWDLENEKEYLKELKKKDEKKYKKTLEIMEQEYESSMLWWKNSVKQKDSSSILSFLDNIKTIFKKDNTETVEHVEKKEEKEPETVKKEKVKPEKTKKTEKKNKKKDVKQTEDSKEELKAVSSKIKKQNDSVTSKLSSGLKKWFTVPEEEKRLKKKADLEQIQPEKSESVKEKKVKKTQDIDDYEKEMDRIEKEEKIKRAQKNKQEKNLAKNKAMQKIKRAQEKQKNKI